MRFFLLTYFSQIECSIILSFISFGNGFVCYYFILTLRNISKRAAKICWLWEIWSDRQVQKKCSDSDLNNSVGCKIYSRDDCELENDVSSLTYILYSLEFCAFLQGFWPLDRSTFVFIVSLISKKEDDYFQLEQIRDVYGKRNSRKKDLNSSVILRGGSKEKSASDVIHQVFTKINFSFNKNSR